MLIQERMAHYKVHFFFADSNTELLKSIERKELEMKILHGNVSFLFFFFLPLMPIESYLNCETVAFVF